MKSRDLTPETYATRNTYTHVGTSLMSFQKYCITKVLIQTCLKPLYNKIHSEADKSHDDPEQCKEHPVLSNLPHDGVFQPYALV